MIIYPHTNMPSKRKILRFRAANKDLFEAIKKGTKKVETRAATVKYKNIKTGDTIDFICGKERFQKTVKRATIFKNISVMLKKYKFTDIMPGASSVKSLEDVYKSFPGYPEKIKKFGIIALELAP